MTGEPTRSLDLEPAARDPEPQGPAPAPQGGPNDRRGFALAGALLAMVIVGALVTGSFFAASQEQAIGLSARYNDAALYVAEYGLNHAMAIMTKDSLSAVPAAGIQRTYNVSGSAQGSATVWIRPVGTNLWLVVSRGVSNGGDLRYRGGSRVLGLFVRTYVVGFNDSTAMTIQRGLTVQGSAQVSGQDTFPIGVPQWSACHNKGLKDAVDAPNASLVSGQKANSIIGNVVQDTSIRPSTFNDFGDVTYSTLAAMADITYNGDWKPGPDPDGTATTCNRANDQNWGEPYDVVTGCKDYFPIIHVTGNLQIAGNGRGQGILLVDGSIEIQGAFQFWGVTITKRYIKTFGNGGHINGTVMAADSAIMDNNVAIGNSVVQLSSCAVQRAVNAAGGNQSIPIKNHAWVDLTAAGAGF